MKRDDYAFITKLAHPMVVFTPVIITKDGNDYQCRTNWIMEADELPIPELQPQQGYLMAVVAELHGEVEKTGSGIAVFHQMQFPVPESTQPTAPFPEKITIAPGDTVVFSLKGVEHHSDEVEEPAVSKVWSDTGVVHADKTDFVAVGADAIHYYRLDRYADMASLPALSVRILGVAINESGVEFCDELDVQAEIDGYRDAIDFSVALMGWHNFHAQDVVAIDCCGYFAEQSTEYQFPPGLDVSAACKGLLDVLVRDYRDWLEELRVEHYNNCNWHWRDDGEGLKMKVVLHNKGHMVKVDLP